MLQRRRRQFRDIISYVNDNGGWTIVGWYLLGSVTDATMGGDKVKNPLLTIHISYLMLSLYHSWIRNNSSFRHLVIPINDCLLGVASESLVEEVVKALANNRSNLY